MYQQLGIYRRIRSYNFITIDQHNDIFLIVCLRFDLTIHKLYFLCAGQWFYCKDDKIQIDLKNFHVRFVQTNVFRFLYYDIRKLIQVYTIHSPSKALPFGHAASFKSMRFHEFIS